MKVQKEGMVRVDDTTIGLHCNELSVLIPLDHRPPTLISNQLLSDCLSPEHAYRVQEELHDSYS